MFKPSFRHGSIAVALVLLTGAVGAQGTAAGAMKAGARVSRVDSAFMKQAARNNSTEIEASKLALTKAGSASVKTFAQQMIDEHTKTGEEMKSLAASKGVGLPDAPSAAQAAKIKMLSAKSGADFDKHYAEIVGVAAHKDTVKLFQKESTSGKDADVKAFATKALPSLQHHLEMAMGLKSNAASKA